MKTDDAFKRLLKGADPILKVEGFRRKGLNFMKELDRICLIVNFQKSRDTGEDGVKFTINLGVFAQTLNKYSWNVPVTAPSIWNCPVLVRIGDLLPEKQDKWWEIGFDDVSTEIETEVVGALKTVCVSFLNGFTSDEDIRKYFWKLVRKGEALYPMVLNLCALEAELGSKKEFLEALQVVKSTAVQVGVPSSAMEIQIKELKTIEGRK